MSVVFGVVVLSPFIVMTFLGISPLLEDPDGLPGAHLPSNIENGRWGAFLSIMLWNTAGFDNAGTCAAEARAPLCLFSRSLRSTIKRVLGWYPKDPKDPLTSSDSDSDRPFRLVDGHPRFVEAVRCLQLAPPNACVS